MFRFVTVRTVVLAFAVLLAGLAGLAGQAPHEAAAAGPCNVFVSLDNSSGRIYAHGVSSCSRSGKQTISTYLKVNGNRYGETGTNQGWTWSIGSFNVSGARCFAGDVYQAVTVHTFDGYGTTTTYGSPQRICG